MDASKAQQADPILDESQTPAQFTSLLDLQSSHPIDAALIEMRLPPHISLKTVQLAIQCVETWTDQQGQSHTIDPAVVLWSLSANDTENSRYRGSLIGVNNGADILTVAHSDNVLGIIGRAAGGFSIATDAFALSIWRRTSAPLQDNIVLRHYPTSEPDSLPAELNEWAQEHLLETYDIKNGVFIGERALSATRTLAFYRVDIQDREFTHERISPLVNLQNTQSPVVRLGSMQNPWRGERGTGTSLIQRGARQKRLDADLENPIANPLQKIPGLEGDIQAVIAEAETDYARRCKTSAWQNLLPPDNVKQSIRQAENFSNHVNRELLDLHIPEDCAKPVESTGILAKLPYTARIRDLPFWGNYKLVELTERLGGRRRRTSLLWASGDPPLPDLGTIKSSLANNIERTAIVKDHARRIGIDPSSEDAVNHVFSTLERDVRPIVGLDGASAPIHSINCAQKINGTLVLNSETARDYLAFFCAYVHGDDGSFTILEDKDEATWAGFYHNQKGRFGDIIFPMRLWQPLKNQTQHSGDIEFVIEASVTYGGGLFRALFKLLPDGLAEMLTDIPITSDLEVRAYRWNPKNNFLLSVFKELG